MNQRGGKILFLPLAMALLALWPAPVFAANRPQLRVLTYNIHHGQGTDGKFDLERIAKLITSVKPDLVALQEVDRKTKRSRGVDQAEKLGSLTGMYAEFGRAMDHLGGEYGEAILSKVKPRETTVYALPHDAENEPRAAIAVRVKPGDDLPELMFWGTHLCHRREANRLAQAREINRLVPTAGLPAVLGGDLNAHAGGDAMNEFDTRWKDTRPKARKIDYVLVREGDPWRVVDTQVIDDRVASDHRPILVVLEWRGPKK